MKIKRIIISGGGTGGHIFPAVAIANEVKKRNPEAQILFIGAKGKMEMEKVPEAGYQIIGLPITGFQRKLSLKNLALPFKLIGSLLKALSIINKFKPQVIVGVGGYASAPTMYAGSLLKKPVLIQEQNGFPGKTNQSMAKRASKFCVAYEGLEKYFTAEKTILTGNPVRFDMVQIEGKREEAIQHFGINPNLKTILVVGGSLGARTLNESVKNSIHQFKDENVQILWQSGKANYAEMLEFTRKEQAQNVHLLQFIKRMDLAYAAADIIISRAGAIAISEMCLIGKPVILVPSPNVAEDHQTKNAMALVKNDAAILVKDVEARETLLSTVFHLAKDEERQKALANNIQQMGKPHATESIVDEIEKLIQL